MTASPTSFSAPPRPVNLAGRLSLFAADIKIQHSVFALPWALLSAVLAGKTSGGKTPLTIGKILLILMCMVTARTVAMAANRIFDAELDAKNPRTARRGIPSGNLSRGFVSGIAVLCASAFIAATGGFEILYRNPWPLLLSVPVLLFLSTYPFLKRFTRLCHYYLGAALAIAPICAWVAVTGSLAWPPLVMFAIVICWTAGFDIIYACQDYESDLATGVFSVPAKLGVSKALWVSRATHLVAAAMLVVLGRIVPEFGWIYGIGAGLAIGLLIVEQSLVKPGDLSKVNLAFFTINGVMSVMLGTLGIIDLVK